MVIVAATAQSACGENQGSRARVNDGAPDGGGEPMTGDTIVRSSSALSKTAVAAALLDLAEEGKVDLLA